MFEISNKPLSCFSLSLRSVWSRSAYSIAHAPHMPSHVTFFNKVCQNRLFEPHGVQVDSESKSKDRIDQSLGQDHIAHAKR